MRWPARISWRCERGRARPWWHGESGQFWPSPLSPPPHKKTKHFRCKTNFWGRASCFPSDVIFAMIDWRGPAICSVTCLALLLSRHMMCPRILYPSRSALCFQRMWHVCYAITLFHLSHPLPVTWSKAPSVHSVSLDNSLLSSSWFLPSVLPTRSRMYTCCLKALIRLISSLQLLNFHSDHQNYFLPWSIFAETFNYETCW